MNHALPRWPCRLVLASLLAAAALPLAAAAPQGRHLLDADAGIDQVSPGLDRQIVEAVGRNIEMLQREGRLPAKSVAKVSGLGWPMGPGSGPANEWFGITGFVDLDPAFPNRVRDYACGTRSYDTAAGYNHRGTDIVPWPFPWYLMDNAPVDIRAAAPGTLIEKRDGANDRACSWDGPDDANYVIVLHADGSIARYLHIKRGSVTARPIGSAIAAGEVIGQVGSSGISKLPHLHFEVRANNHVNAPVIEPFQGACNTSSASWSSQRPYRDPLLTRLSTHSGEPHYPTCPDTTEIPRLDDHFEPGETVTFLASFRDLQRGQVSQFRVIDPDGQVVHSWSYDSATDPEVTTDYVSAGYWTWSHALPDDARQGAWTYEADFQGITSRHAFSVGSTSAIADMRGLVGAWYEPATSGQGFELHWINDRTALLFFYGHHDDGRNFFVIGQRDGRFDFGQEVVFELYQTLGGRFNGLDPGAIERPVWGQARITFVSCEAAVAELDGADGVQVLNLQRLGRIDGLDCQ
ncbi:MAG TPA: peptidoglycan DD-metalloendopeptidase family protein [Arenimonas sp.]|nr:peptidoglycan DD-metalloendopeptidase family protein [Arenimonas sp.]